MHTRRRRTCHKYKIKMTTEMGFQTEIAIILRENASQVIYEMHRAIVEILTRSGPSAAR